MQDENVKIFKVRGEYKMSEDDNFKTAKSSALDSAEKNLGIEVANFLRERISNLEDNDIADISSKFLKKDEPVFVRKNLSDDEMICYADLTAEINLAALDNFLKNFEVFKLEKKVEKLQADLKSLEDKHTRLIVNLKDFIGHVIHIESKTSVNRQRAISHCKLGDIFSDLREYWSAIVDFGSAKEKDSSISLEDKLLPIIKALTQEINLNPNDSLLYDTRGFAYSKLEKYDEAISDYTQAIKLDPNASLGFVYDRRATAYEAIGEIEKSEKDYAKAKELRRW